MPFRLGIATALWRRPAVAEAVLAHTATLGVEGVELVCVAVRSPGDPEPAADVPGWTYVEAPNAPLSDKFNAAVEALRPLGVDAVMVIGSDDLVSAGYVARAVAAVEAGADFVYGSECAFYDVATGRAMLTRPHRLGAGRVLSAAWMGRLGWRPWPSGLARRLDGAMDRRLGRPRAMAVPPCQGDRTAASAPVVVDLKGAVNLWSYEDIERWAARSRHAVPLDGAAVRALFEAHFPAALPLLDLPKRPAPPARGVAPPINPRAVMDPDYRHPSPERPVRVRALRTYTNRHEEGEVRRGDRFYVSEHRAKALARARSAEIIEAEPEPEPAPPLKEEKAAPRRVTKEEKAAPKRATKAAAPAPSAELKADMDWMEANSSKDVSTYHVGGGYYVLPDGTKVRGKANAEKALAKIEG